VPTFRDEGGLWRSQRAEDLASPEAFKKHPDEVWEWYRERRLHIARCDPHAGQRTLALLQQHFPLPKRVLVATTNEDDLLERAGVQPVLHLHGSLFITRCSGDCGWAVRDDDANGRSFLDCPRCGAPVRPGSVWFGEPLPDGPLRAIEHFDPDACLVIGSSSLVQPASAIGPELALAGAPVVEVNPQPTPLSQVDGVTHLMGQAKTILPRLVDLMTSRTMRQRASGEFPAPG
nr:NAD-dependent deacylase [Planctomycetota bacterium]